MNLPHENHANVSVFISIYDQRHTLEEEKRHKKRQRLLLLFGLTHQIFTTRMILKKRMNRIKATWWNGCLEKMDDHPVHTIPNHHPIPKWMFKSILLLNDKWGIQVRSPKQQRRPLPSLLSLSFFYGVFQCRIIWS